MRKWISLTKHTCAFILVWLSLFWNWEVQNEIWFTPTQVMRVKLDFFNRKCWIKKQKWSELSRSSLIFGWWWNNWSRMAERLEKQGNNKRRKWNNTWGWSLTVVIGAAGAVHPQSEIGSDRLQRSLSIRTKILYESFRLFTLILYNSF